MTTFRSNNPEHQRFDHWIGPEIAEETDKVVKNVEVPITEHLEQDFEDGKLFDTSDYPTKVEQKHRETAKRIETESTLLKGAMAEAGRIKKKFLASGPITTPEKRELLRKNEREQLNEFIKDILSNSEEFEEKAKKRIVSRHEGVNDIIQKLGQVYSKTGIARGRKSDKTKESYRDRTILQAEQRRISGIYQKQIAQNEQSILEIDHIIDQVLPNSDYIQPDRSLHFGMPRVAVIPRLSNSQSTELINLVDEQSIEAILPGYLSLIKLSPISAGVDRRYARNILSSALLEQDSEVIWTAIIGSRAISAKEYEVLRQQQTVIENIKIHDINQSAKEKAIEHFTSKKEDTKQARGPKYGSKYPFEAAEGHQARLGDPEPSPSSGLDKSSPDKTEEFDTGGTLWDVNRHKQD